MHRILKIASSRLPFIIELYSLMFRLVFRTSKNSKSNSSKKISVINTHSQGGGAAKVALDIIRGSKYASNMHFFVHENFQSSNNIHVIEKMKSTRLIRWFQEMERIGGWLDFSFISPLNLLKNNHFQTSRIIHLHNLHGYYFSYAILQSLAKKKKVIWTLHDEHLITGHCSCTLSCELWKSGCGNCPKLETYPSVKLDNTKKMLAYKTRLLNKINPIIVCPSNWLAERVKVAYPFLKTVKMIPNGVDTEVFKPMDKNVLRSKLGLPKDALIILFAAELATKNPFKGGEIVESLIETSTFQNCYFVTIGGETIKKSDYHIPFGYISEQEKMAELYATSDLMLYPTRADNLPLVVLEAMSCGLPVISSNIGGIVEIIENEKNGFLIDHYFKTELFQKAITHFIAFTEVERLQISSEARKTILYRFSKEKMINEYDTLYEDVSQF